MPRSDYGCQRCGTGSAHERTILGAFIVNLCTGCTNDCLDFFETVAASERERAFYYTTKIDMLKAQTALDGIDRTNEIIGYVSVVDHNITIRELGRGWVAWEAKKEQAS
jgi:hypothetical protein